MNRLLLFTILLLLSRFATAATGTLLPRPPELEPDV